MKRIDLASPRNLALLLEAEHLHALGFSCFPVDGKVPAVPWKAFQETYASAEQYVRWWAEGRYNIGIATGRISGVVVVDTDSADAETWAIAHLPRTPMITTTARGKHRYFRHPKTPVRNKARIHTGTERISLDVRGDGGFVIGPGSTHPTGVRYERLGTWPDSVDGLPVFDVSWVAAEIHPSQATLTAPPGPIDRDATLVRVRRYLEATPPAVEGQGGDVHTYSVACRVVRGFDLDDVDARLVLSEWNQRCQPRWPLHDLDEKIANARQYGEEAIGGRLGCTTGLSADDIVIPETVDPNTFGSTDTGNAELFAACYGRDVRYDHTRERYLLWSGHAFHLDRDGQVEQLTKSVVRRRLTAAATLTDDASRTRAVKWALASESRDRRRAILTLAQSEPSIRDAGKDWDTEPYLLGTPSGVVELETGRFRAGRRQDGITQQTYAPYDAGAACPRWNQFIEEISDGQPDWAQFVQRAVGYSLTGDIREQRFFLDEGGGANGKSTFLETLVHVLGTYAYVAPISAFVGRGSQVGEDLAALAGKRLVVATEPKKNATLNEARLKSLVGGDRQNARRLYGHPFEFNPVCTIWLAVNEKPRAADSSYGFWRKVVVIPFKRTFAGSAADQGLSEALRKEASGILNWCIEGRLAWQKRGLDPPASIGTATDAYESESDPLTEFLEDSVVVTDDDTWTAAGELYAAYGRWCDQQGIVEKSMERLTRAGFGRAMRRHAAKTRHPETRRKGYLGIRVEETANP